MNTRYFLPVETVSEANRSQREHWGAKHRRHKEQASLSQIQALLATSSVERTMIRKDGAIVTLRRRAIRMMDTDNLAAALKHVRDGIARAVGLDDGDERWTWVYDQRKCAKGEPVGVEVEIEA